MFSSHADKNRTIKSKGETYSSHVDKNRVERWDLEDFTKVLVPGVRA
jgi:hypothetical protein